MNASAVTLVRVRAKSRRGSRWASTAILTKFNKAVSTLQVVKRIILRGKAPLSLRFLKRRWPGHSCARSDLDPL